MPEPQKINIKSAREARYIPRLTDRVCKTCGHPDYCHNPEVPPAFPFLAPNLCVGIIETWVKAADVDVAHYRFVPIDPKRFGEAMNKMRAKRGLDPLSCDWSAMWSGLGMRACTCRAFVLKEEETVAEPQKLQELLSS